MQKQKVSFELDAKEGRITPQELGFRRRRRSNGNSSLESDSDAEFVEPPPQKR